MENKKRALGKGLEQLFNSENLDLDSFERTVYETASKEEIIDIDLDELRPNPYQPRKVFKDELLDDLALSIKEHGVFQPIIIKKSIKGYEIIAGERRVRASRVAGLKTIPAIVRNLDDEQMMEIALLENLQRENLSAIEEATAYRSMLQKLNLTQEELSKKVGKSRSHITNILGLLRLPNEVQEMIANGDLTMGHARVLSKLDNQEEILKMAHEIINTKLPVRDLEEKSINSKRVNKQKHEQNKEYEFVEELLKEKLDTKIKIHNKKLEISFTNTADLNRILDILNIKE